MSWAPFFKFYTDDFVRGTMAMTAAEVGDYVRLLCAIYDQEGRIKNDPHVLRHVLHCNRIRDAKAKIGRLISLGKLSIDVDNFLHNGRADKEISRIRTESEASDTPSTQAKKSTKSRARARPSRSQKPDSFSNEKENARRRARHSDPFEAALWKRLERIEAEEKANGHDSQEGFTLDLTANRSLEACDDQAKNAGNDHAGKIAEATRH